MRKSKVYNVAKEVQQRAINKHIDTFFKPELFYRFYIEECELYAQENNLGWLEQKKIMDVFYVYYRMNNNKGYL